MTVVCGGRGTGAAPDLGVIFRVLGDGFVMGQCTRCGKYAPEHLCPGCDDFGDRVQVIACIIMVGVVVAWVVWSLG